jgi:hypothetical protein
MNRTLALVSLASFIISPLAFAQSATDCRQIAAATVAELRAGYEGWSDEAEQLARAAAGAACVKATLRVQTSAAGSAPGSFNSTAVPAAGASADSMATAGAAPVAQADDQSGDSAEGESEAKETGNSGSWNPFSEIKFNKVSARPGKKPYERRRESLDEED